MTGSLVAGLRNLPRRIGRAANLADVAFRLGDSPLRVLDRNWRAAIEIVRFELIPRRVRANLRVLCDVGANRGDWTAAVLELTRPEGVFAFEPNPKVFAELSARFATSPNVHCVRAAVGATSGEIAFGVEEQPELSSIRPLSARGRLTHGLASGTQRVQVPLVTLDDELKDTDEISLMKFDVQGYEDQVIAGARRVLERTQCLVTEVLYERDYYQGALPFLDLARLIEDVSPLRLSCVSEPSLSPDGMGAWADAVFVKL